MFPRTRKAIAVWIRVSTLTSFALLAGCTAPLSEPEVDSPTPKAEEIQGVDISGDASGAPEGCTPVHIAGRLQGLFDSIQFGDPETVPEYFGDNDGDHTRWQGGHMFSWYCQDTFTAYDLQELGPFFEGQDKKGGRMKLQAVQFNGWEPARGIVHFGPVRLERTLPGQETAQILVGKGAYYCKGETFPVLCLGLGE